MMMYIVPLFIYMSSQFGGYNIIALLLLVIIFIEKNYLLNKLKNFKQKIKY